MPLSELKCKPCEGGTPLLSEEECRKHLSEIQNWQLESIQKISKTFKFKNFQESIAFVNSVAEIAESEGHHPDILINYNRVTLSLSTHAIKGLSLNDFIVAAKVDALQS